jgi:hypothetical protein
VTARCPFTTCIINVQNSSKISGKLNGGNIELNTKYLFVVNTGEIKTTGYLSYINIISKDSISINAVISASTVNIETASLILNSKAQINTNGRGYDPGLGTGGGGAYSIIGSQSCSKNTIGGVGASYGGLGSSNVINYCSVYLKEGIVKEPYGSLKSPQDWGSGGGVGLTGNVRILGGSGGGKVSGTLFLELGSLITADGAPGKFP